MVQESENIEPLTPEEIEALEPEARTERYRTIAHLIHAEKRLVERQVEALQDRHMEIEEQLEECEAVVTSLEESLDGLLNSLPDEHAALIETELLP